MSDNEAANTGEERANLLLRSGRFMFLQTAGYTEAEISDLGDLAMVPSEKMSELLRRQALKAIAKELGRKRIRPRTFTRKKRKTR